MYAEIIVITESEAKLTLCQINYYVYFMYEAEALSGYLVQVVQLVRDRAGVRTQVGLTPLLGSRGVSSQEQSGCRARGAHCSPGVHIRKVAPP